MTARDSAKLSVRDRLERRAGSFGAAGYAAVLSLVVLAIAGTVGLVTALPWLFPSLGPTVMLFFESPRQPASRPLNTLVGHAVGIIAGLGCLLAFGLQHHEPAPVAGLTVGYVAAGALSVAVTTLVLTWIGLPHPPAGASTLIVSLGILDTASRIGAMAAAVVLITVVGWGLNLLLGTRPHRPGGSDSAASYG
jgi:hypothetical protein